jgi:hypothetical protein
MIFLFGDENFVLKLFNFPLIKCEKGRIKNKDNSNEGYGGQD